MTETTLWPDRVFDRRSRPDQLVLVGSDGTRHRMSPGRWHGKVARAEQDLLRRADQPVLDVGCGPGRHAAVLTRWGIPVLGIDSSRAAVLEARRRGAPAKHVSVFDEVPRSGEWGTILLLDGNVGIGGDPSRLLHRCGQILRANGRVLLETEPPLRSGRRWQVRVEFEDASGDLEGPWFPWAIVSASQLSQIATEGGFDVEDIWCSSGRWFAELVRHPSWPEVRSLSA